MSTYGRVQLFMKKNILSAGLFRAYSLIWVGNLRRNSGQNTSRSKFGTSTCQASSLPRIFAYLLLMVPTARTNKASVYFVWRHPGNIHGEIKAVADW